MDGACPAPQQPWPGDVRRTHLWPTAPAPHHQPLPAPASPSRAERKRLFKYTSRHHEPSAGSLRLMTGTSLGEHVLNNFSLLADNRLTHIKVVMLAFACVTLVVGFGLVHSALAQEPTSISTIVARVTGTIIRAF